MFFKNILKTKTLVKKVHKFCFENEFMGDLADKHQTKTCYNFLIRNNNLENGYGFSNPVLPLNHSSSANREVFTGDDVKCDLWHHCYYDEDSGQRKDVLFWSCEDGGLGYLDIVGYNQVSIKLNTQFPALPTGINYVVDGKDCILFSVSGALKCFSNGQLATTAASLPRLIDLCWGYDRLWGIIEGKQNKILYSENLDLTSWLETEKAIELDDEQGACNKLVFFEDDMYAFRDYGITRISEFGTSREFEVFSRYSTKSRIYGKTVVRCGEKIVFLTKDGLYSFNGTDVKKIFPRLDQKIFGVDNKNAVACFDGKRYVLACRGVCDENVVGCEGDECGFVNNFLLFFNLETGKVDVVRGVDVRNLVFVSTQSFCGLFATFNGKNACNIGMLDTSGNVFGKALEKCWSSKFLDFGAEEQIKFVRGAFVSSYTDCVLTLKTNCEKQGFVIAGGTVLGEVKTFLKGQLISAEITATNAKRIYAPKIVYEVEKNKK